jgi:hypothetical protein
MGDSVVLVGDEPAAGDVNRLGRLRRCGLVVTVVYCYTVARLTVEFANLPTMRYGSMDGILVVDVALPFAFIALIVRYLGLATA